MNAFRLNVSGNIEAKSIEAIPPAHKLLARGAYCAVQRTKTDIFRLFLITGNADTVVRPWKQNAPVCEWKVGSGSYVCAKLPNSAPEQIKNVATDSEAACWFLLGQERVSDVA